MHAKLMQDGSVPIPEELRTALHMRPGDRVELRVIEGGLSVKRVPLTAEEERHIWDAHLDEINAGARSQIDDDQVEP